MIFSPRKKASMHHYDMQKRGKSVKRYRIGHAAYQNNEHICQKRNVQDSLYPAASAVPAPANAPPPGSV